MGRMRDTIGGREAGLMGATLAALAVLLLMAVMVAAWGGRYEQRLFHEPVYRLDQGWRLEQPNAAPREFDLPAVLPEGGCVTLSYPMTKLEELISSPVVLLYSNHLALKVYLDGQLLYEYPGQPPLFSKTTGNTYHFVRLPGGYEDKVLRVVTQGMLGDSFGYTFVAPEIGAKASILYGRVYREFPMLASVVLIFVFGMLMSVLYLYCRRKQGMSRSMLYLGLFAILFAGYALCETDFAHLTVANSYLVYALTFGLLALLPAPALLFFAGSVHPLRQRPLRVAAGLCLANFFFQTLLNFLGSWDFREMLLATHLMVGLGVIAAVYAILRTPGDYAGRNRTLISAAPMLLGAAVDVVRFNLGYTRYNSLCFQLGMLAFVLCQLVIFLRGYFQMYRATVQADAYRRMAYLDLLTGLGNRNAYERRIDQLEERWGVEPVGCVAADINNLKQTNDQLGHARGDALIVDCAQLLKAAFQGAGEVFRTGGDEFVALLTGLDAGELDRQVDAFRRALAAYNAGHECAIELALGYDCFRPEEDQAVTGLIKRVDALMYRDKQAAKRRGGVPDA